ncbi:MAG: hypothetical protein HN380_22930 [Victivallales bacterium]|nr:hypothetical protein [Victivallales bacterium]
MSRSLALLSLIACVSLPAADYSWQEPHAEVVASGDLRWAPKPFAYTPGPSVRYIDYENGSDAKDGRTQQAAWKHHPWDKQAKEKAAACKGSHTYVFKRGVVYRGALVTGESGTPEAPIQLTSDPNWGKGEAGLYGSERIVGWQRGAKHADIPEAGKVWVKDLDFAPRCVWLVQAGGAAQRIALARSPNWSVSDPDDIKSEWWEWENPGHPFENYTKTAKGRRLHLGIDTKHLTQPAEYYEGGTIWTEYGWVMGTPYPAPIEAVDIEQKGLGFGGQWGGVGGQKIVRFNRYYIEDKPHYLDAPGEFWFDKKGAGGKLYLRLPGDQDPNTAQVEVARRGTLIDSVGMSHVRFSGLTFRFTNVYWGLTAGPWVGKAVDPACIRLLGSGTDLQVTNCRFEHVNMAVRIKAVGDSDAIDRVLVTDNDIHHTDHGGTVIEDGLVWGRAMPPAGRLFDVKVLRNRMSHTGMRPTRFGQGHALIVQHAETMEVAGNILDRCYGSGIFLWGGKNSGFLGDRPLSRMLVHHNKVTNPMLNTNDWGGIETWQGGPAYVYNNISGNPGGYWNYNFKLNPGKKPNRARFGHAYYLDGAFKNYHFNNIAWGKSSDPYSRLGNTSAFQEIHSYQNTFFNNTIYNFVIGSRRQAPQAGRNKFLGNIWQNIGYWVFRHADPAKTEADGNAADAGKKHGHYELGTNAYGRNLFQNLADHFGVLEPSGRWHMGLPAYQKVLANADAIASDIGKIVEEPILPNAEKHDFRPAAGSPAIDGGVKVFVPWSLHATVAEYHFYRSKSTQILDEHWYMTPYHAKRDDYHQRPMYPLTGVNLDASAYTKGTLEDWTAGALTLNGANQYAVASNELVTKPFAHTSGAPPRPWLSATVPTAMVSGKPYRVQLQLQGIPDGSKVHMDLHWNATEGNGGFNTWGGEAQTVKGGGPYAFTVKPAQKPNLKSFTVLAYVSKDGDWKSQFRLARIEVPKATEDEGKTKVVKVADGKGTKGATEVAGDDLKSPEILRSNFAIELVFRAEKGGRLIGKMATAGYELRLDEQGRALFQVAGPGGKGNLVSTKSVTDGKWHHLIAEADREAKTLTLYLDGKRNAQGPGIDANVSLANPGDLTVGGTADGDCIRGAIDFLRISRGTLADAKTTIEELYAWEFNGPHFRDFNGRLPADGTRDAGALEFTGR